MATTKWDLTNMSSSDKHPIHSRGLQARRYDTAVTGPLTNAAIKRYILLGHYGPDLQQREQERVKQAKERRVQSLNKTREKGKSKNELYAQILDGLL